MIRLLRPRSRGQGLVEFALVFPIFMLLLLGMFDIGRGVFAYNELTNAAREGARLAVVNQDPVAIADRIKGQSSGTTVDQCIQFIEVDSTFPTCNKGATLPSAPCPAVPAVGCIAHVEVWTDYTPITPIIGNFIGTLTLTANSEFRHRVRLPQSRHSWMGHGSVVPQAAMTPTRAAPSLRERFTKMRGRREGSSDSGQIIVLFALALVALVAMAGLVIEAGNAFAQQRIAQNGADATANAGTIQIAQKLSGASKTGDDVANAVAASALANQLVDPVAIYTDNVGVPLSPTVTVALGTALPPNARGVKVTGDRISGTTLAGLLGITSLKASAEATAIAGAASGGCPPDTACGLLPVTFPVQISVCDDSGRLTGIGEPGDLWQIITPPLTAANESILPLCKTAPGAVGWLDLQPGVNLAGEIVTPVNDFDYPSWVQTQPGNPNSVEDELNDNYAGKTVLIPMFDGTCRIQPATGATPCPIADQGVDPVGNNTFYHIPYLAAFHLDQAITQGANVDDCNNHNPLATPQLNTTTPEFLGCLTGWFVDYILPGEVDPFTTIDDTTVVAVQLIK